MKKSLFKIVPFLLSISLFLPSCFLGGSSGSSEDREKQQELINKFDFVLDDKLKNRR